MPPDSALKCSRKSPNITQHLILGRLGSFRLDYHSGWLGSSTLLQLLSSSWSQMRSDSNLLPLQAVHQTERITGKTRSTYVHLNEIILCEECLRWSYRTSCTDTNVFLRSCPVSDQHASDQHTSPPPLMLSFWLSLFFVARARLFRTRIDEDIAQSSQPPHQISDVESSTFPLGIQDCSFASCFSEVCGDAR